MDSEDEYDSSEEEIEDENYNSGIFKDTQNLPVRSLKKNQMDSEDEYDDSEDEIEDENYNNGIYIDTENLPVMRLDAPFNVEHCGIYGRLVEL